MVENERPARQALAVSGRSAPGRVTGKLKTALDLMIWSGEKRKSAAEQAGLADHSVRAALRKAHVLAYWRAELQALREGERPANVHRLAALRDQDTNKMAAVAAIKTLEQVSDADEQRPHGAPRAPGVVIVIASKPELQDPSPRIIEITPPPASHVRPEEE